MEYIIFLISIMVISGTIKQHHLFDCLFYIANLKIKSKRLLVMFISVLGGVLPIEGRVTVSAGILNTISPETCSTCKPSRAKFGVIDYISTHHYYLWSPLEKTIILPMAAMGIGYSAMLAYTLPLLIISVMYIMWYVFVKLKDSDIVINLLPNKYNALDYLKTIPFMCGIFLAVVGVPTEYVFGVLALFYLSITNSFSLRTINTYINWKLVGTLVVILSLGHFVGAYNEEILSTLKGIHISMHSILGAILMSVTVFVSSWLLGSSGKFAGIVSLMVIIYGAQWFVWFFVIDFIAYNLSPMHKCVSIGNLYFGTKISEYIRVVGTWQIFLLLYAGVYTFVL